MKNPPQKRHSDETASSESQSAFPSWGGLALPAGALWGAAMGAIFGLIFGNLLIGLALGAGLGVGIGVSLLAAAFVKAAHHW